MMVMFEAEADCRRTDSFGDKENATPANTQHTPMRRPVKAIVTVPGEASSGSIPVVKVREGFWPV